MSKADKLFEKLTSGSINAQELRTLLKQRGWRLARSSSSHEQWVGPNNERMTLATHSKDLMRYQIKEAQEKVK